MVDGRTGLLSIHQFSTGFPGYLAAGAFDQDVEVWQLDGRQRVSAFSTVLELGLGRMALTGKDRPVVVAAAWGVKGVAGYDAVSGEMLWHRRDLPHTQELLPLDAGRVLVDREGLDHVLDVDTGATVSTMRSIGPFIDWDKTADRGCWFDSRDRLVVGRYDTGAAVTPLPPQPQDGMRRGGFLRDDRLVLLIGGTLIWSVDLREGREIWSLHAPGTLANLIGIRDNGTVIVATDRGLFTITPEGEHTILIADPDIAVRPIAHLADHALLISPDRVIWSDRDGAPVGVLA